MKYGWYLFFGIALLLIGAAGVVSFIVLAAGGERMLRWIPALLVCAVFCVSGVRCIIDYRRADKDE